MSWFASSLWLQSVCVWIKTTLGVLYRGTASHLCKTSKGYPWKQLSPPLRLVPAIITNSLSQNARTRISLPPSPPSLLDGLSFPWHSWRMCCCHPIVLARTDNKHFFLSPPPLPSLHPPRQACKFLSALQICNCSHDRWTQRESCQIVNNSSNTSSGGPSALRRNSPFLNLFILAKPPFRPWAQF